MIFGLVTGGEVGLKKSGLSAGIFFSDSGKSDVSVKSGKVLSYFIEIGKFDSGIFNAR